MIMLEIEKSIEFRLHTMLPILNEKQQRLYLATEAKSLGHGGITTISRLSGVSKNRISRGISQINENDQLPAGRVRKAGGGRKKEEDKQTGLKDAIEETVSAHTMGNPENPLIWSSKSLRHIQAALKESGYSVSHEVIRKILISLGYSLQLNRKTKEGGGHVDRNAQFEFINSKAKFFFSEKDPVISVDCKKKEIIGNYINPGKEWTEIKHPIEVNVYDFIDKTNGKASPYGVYDLTNNQGWINIGISSDTAFFAVSTIRDWWLEDGKKLYPNSKKLYINADGGGSNGSRNRLWKEALQSFSNEMDIEIHVSHFPPGTSKWNKIEHRLFSFISKNWRGRPLESLAIIVNLINATTTTKGLSVKAKVDEKIYEKGLKITNEQMEKWNLERDEFHGEWNYIIRPNLT